VCQAIDFATALDKVLQRLIAVQCDKIVTKVFIDYNVMRERRKEIRDAIFP
jgi:hypothetical protein